jgi:hypothetical protein
LKNNYSKVLRYNLLKNYPTLMLLQKKNNVGFPGTPRGSYAYQPTISSPGANTGGNFAIAQQQWLANPYGVGQAYQMPPVSYFGGAFIPSVTWKQALSSQTSFIDMLSKAVKDEVAKLKQNLGQQAFSDGYLSIGQVSAITTTTVANDTIVLTDATDAQHFYGGNTNTGGSATYVCAALSRTNGTQRALGTANVATGGAPVLAVPRNSSAQIVFNNSVLDATNGISTALAVGDYLFNGGDVQASSNGTLPGLPGFEAWCPYGGVTNPNDDFYGVNRFSDGLLQGTSYDGTTDNSVLDAIRGAIVRGQQNVHGNYSIAAMTPAQYRLLENDILTTLRTPPDYVKVGIAPSLEVGENEYVPGIDIGDVICVKDPNCRNDRIVLFNMDDCEHLILGDGFTPWGDDGQLILRAATAAGIEIRFEQDHTMVMNPQNVASIKVNPATV